MFKPAVARGLVGVAASLFIARLACADPVVADYELVSSTRVGRSSVDYTYRVRVTNGAQAFQNVQLSVASVTPATVIVHGDVYVGMVPANATRMSPETFTLRQDRTRPFDPASLKWTVTGQPVPVDLDPVSLIDLRFVELEGRVGHQGLFPINGEPVKGAGAALCLVELSGSVVEASYTLKSETGDVLRTGAFAPNDDTEVNQGDYIASLDLPQQKFEMIVSGRDTSGRTFSHSWPHVFAPTFVALENPAPHLHLSPGEAIEVPLTITNYGPPGTFEVGTFGQSPLAQDLEPHTVTLASQGSSVVSIPIKVPREALEQSQLSVSIAVVPQDAPDSPSISSIRVRVETPR